MKLNEEFIESVGWQNTGWAKNCTVMLSLLTVDEFGLCAICDQASSIHLYREVHSAEKLRYVTYDIKMALRMKRSKLSPYVKSYALFYVL